MTTNGWLQILFFSAAILAVTKPNNGSAFAGLTGSTTHDNSMLGVAMLCACERAHRRPAVQVLRGAARQCAPPQYRARQHFHPVHGAKTIECFS